MKKEKREPYDGMDNVVLRKVARSGLNKAGPKGKEGPQIIVNQ